MVRVSTSLTVTKPTASNQTKLTALISSTHLILSLFTPSKPQESGRTLTLTLSFPYSLPDSCWTNSLRDGFAEIAWRLLGNHVQCLSLKPKSKTKA